MLDAFELGVAFLQVGLVFVGGEQLGVGQVTVVADQREAAVGGGVAGYEVLGDGPGDVVVGAGDLAVAGVVARPAAPFLPEGFLDAFFDVEADPAGRADLVERGPGGRLGGDFGLDPGLGRGQPPVEVVERGDAAGDAVTAGFGVTGGLGRTAYPHDAVALG